LLDLFEFYTKKKIILIKEIKKAYACKNSNNIGINQSE